MQLDIFANSRDVMLRNDVLSALQRYDAREAQQAHRRLSEEYPDDDSIPQLTILPGALALRSTVAFSKHQVAAETRFALVEKNTPAARRMWDELASTRWLLPLWRELAQRASSLPCRADSLDTRAAALWLQAGGWSDARDAVLAIESWRRIPRSARMDDQSLLPARRTRGHMAPFGRTRMARSRSLCPARRTVG
jgi:hypothetical protein